MRSLKRLINLLLILVCIGCSTQIKTAEAPLPVEPLDTHLKVVTFFKRFNLLDTVCGAIILDTHNLIVDVVPGNCETWTRELIGSNAVQTSSTGAVAGAAASVIK